ncbi:uncharacterized protein [Chelonus insularis]|uniref:uncharacterized protein isoform X2 n=1 Tax=Chelonus insularis TaxID=460826 RepID=UPI00158A39FA|nr:uncharacterized protein LOC118074132 isoform X2 [Chelonus insularis]
MTQAIILSEGRTALHYCSSCKDPETIWDFLIRGGCDASICDKKGHPAAYYLSHPSEIELPQSGKMNEKKHSNGKSETLDFKPSNIRIWIHNRDIGKLQQVIWEGHGSKLQREISNNPKIRKFLEAVPFIMVSIKQIHSAVVKNDIDTFLKKIEDPVSPIILSAKDSNGLTILHKAVGLGHIDIAKEIVQRYSVIVTATDNDGKTPLHYAAALKDSGAMYDLLVEYGADESKLDSKQKAAAFYKNRPGDIDISTLMRIPDAPRVSGTNYPKNWDWKILETADSLTKAPKKRRPPVSDSSEDIADVSNTEGNDTTDVTITEDDSAFGSAESPMKTEESSDMVFGELKNDNVERNNENPEIDAEERKDNVVAEEEQTNDEEDEVVVGDTGIHENHEEAVEDHSDDEEDDEEVVENHEKNEEEELETKEKNSEPEDNENKNLEEDDEENKGLSTGDSGVDETRSNEDQVIIGEHEELPEADLTEGIMLDDPEVENLLVNGNMEQLAALVLNGEGRRLIGRQSGNPELQAFIDNVSSYVGKINAVHIAAREGNLRGLQNALDRRKFAIARDSVSPHGATPLHVAVIFGHTAIIRYLAGRFPETVHAVDIDGRTPLHYAATLADNGHYYNLLLHLGANPLIKDNFEQKADYYKEHQDDLSHKRLLRDFGEREELADEMLADKDIHSTSLPIFREEEGRYLASSLGTPLIKGLTEVAHKRPKNPVTYLATYLNNFATEQEEFPSEKSDVLIIPESRQENYESNNDEHQSDEEDDAGYPRSPESNAPESAFNTTNRDEHGQTIIHFSAIRTHPKDGLFNILQERQVNIGYRDELYRTARDVAEDANFQENVDDIDRYVVYLAARGETEKLVELLLEGYDHILDTEDGGVNIIDVAAERNRESTVQFLQSIPKYVTQQEKLHRAIRRGDLEAAKKIFESNGGGGTLFAIGKNTLGRCSLHIAILCEHVEIVEYISTNYRGTLRIGDNLERTALHYAMGVPSVETLSNILINAGAKRVHKDLKSRQPSYYFMNKTDIERLQDEEQTMAK